MRCGFKIIKAKDIDRIGVQGIVQKLRDRVGDMRVYVSVDIDVLDPAFAPGKPLSLSSFARKYHIFFTCPKVLKAENTASAIRAPDVVLQPRLAVGAEIHPIC